MIVFVAIVFFFSVLLIFLIAGIIDFFEWTHTKNRIISLVPQSFWKKLKTGDLRICGVKNFAVFL